MPTPWFRAVQETGQLTVFPTPQLLRAPAWGQPLFTRILSEFNRLAATGRFGVRLVQSTQPQTPQGTGANVQFDISTGRHTIFDLSGQPVQETLNVAPGNIRGVAYKITGGRFGKVVKAFVFVPLDPRLGPGQRGVGAGIKVGLSLHELLHAAGLDATDPGHNRPVTPADVYTSGGVLIEGRTPDLDKIVSSRAEPDALGQFVLTSRTISQVQDVWLLGQF